MRDYGKVQSTFWTSDDIRQLTDTGRMLALYLLTGPHTNQIGCFRLPDGYVCEDLDWSPQTVRKGFDELLSIGFATRDESCKWVLIDNFLRWNEIENPNQGKSAMRLFEQVPSASPLKPALAMRFLAFSNRFTEEDISLLEGFREPLVEPFRNQEQEQEQEQEYSSAYAEGSGSTASSPRAPVCPHQEIIDLYHEILPMGTQVRVWNSARSKSLQARWREDPKRQDLDWWRRFFGYIAESEFLTGRTQPAPGRDPFVVSLDWLVAPKNFAKVIEGRYHRECA